MSPIIRVTILDDHQSIVDGYIYRLSGIPKFEVVAAITYGDDLEPTLKKVPTDILLLDVYVPTSPDNPNPYPILNAIPKLLQIYPSLKVLVISMVCERRLIRAIMDAGASGYVIKDDPAAIRDLGNVLLSIASGGIYFSQKAYQLTLEHPLTESSELLSSRQLEALSLCAAYPNDTMEELAQKMIVANSTVRNLLSTAYIKLGVHTRAAAVVKARELGILPSHSPTLTM